MSKPEPMLYPRVGVAVFVFDKAGKFILGERKGSNGAGTLGHPGGHLEMFEEFEECAQRETLEETGLALQDIRFLNATNSHFIGKHGSKVHYVTVWMGARRVDEQMEPEVLEPTKCASWNWTSWADVVRWSAQDDSPDNPYPAAATDTKDADARNIFWPIVNLVQIRGAEWNPWDVYQNLTKN